MPEEATPSPELENEAAPEGPSPGPLSLLARAKLLLFAAAVIVVECLVAYLYLPAAAERSAVAAADLTDQPAAESIEESGESPAAPRSDLAEVDLGQFMLTQYQPRSGTTLRIDFHLYGTIKKDDQQAFDAAMKTFQNRIRHEVLVIIRSAELSDLADAGLGLIQRKILAKSNETFGKTLLQSVFINDFSHIEQ